MAKVTMAELAKFAVDEIEGGQSASSVAQKIAAFLLEERRTREYASVMRAIDEELTERGSPQVVITSAHEVSDAIRGQLARALGVTNPVFSEVIDASVIGGVKAVSGEKQIDLTVKRKIMKFKQEIAK